MKNSAILVLAILLMSIPSALAISITMHVQEEYTTVQTGEKLYYDVEVKYPENPLGNREDVTFTIQIISNEEVIAESKLLKAIETQISFTDYILIPETAKSGQATIKVQVENFDALSEDIQTTFYITKNSENDFKYYFKILLIVIILIGAIIIAEIYYFRKRRK
ncbi:hypothetical protein HN604_02240 [archaeon]|jgi:hypothetical protein|nr:hypothetical protein [archaeon]MBT6182880.1 hypothetical protein [archaeon]MBT6606253.1 hypothetical protein [archaeon]MBT7251578.1 hypothetical protein [archaeon]MBT7660881.1 hypothetical protein [archaeon]